MIAAATQKRNGAEVNSAPFAKKVPLSSYSPTEDARQYHRRSGA